MSKLTMDKLVALCKNRGYILAGSEIYTLSLHDALPISEIRAGIAV